MVRSRASRVLATIALLAGVMMFASCASRAVDPFAAAAPAAADETPAVIPTTTSPIDPAVSATEPAAEDDDAPVSHPDMPPSMQPLTGGPTTRKAHATTYPATRPDLVAPKPKKPWHLGSKPTTRPIPAIDKVLIFSIDGLRPDLALRGDTPTIHSLIRQGSFSFWALTTNVAVTLPSHTSMLTGYIPQRHGIEWNRDLPLTKAIYPAVPTIFEVARRHGYTTAMAAGKDKFQTLAKPGALDWLYIPGTTEPDTDATVAHYADIILRQHHPDVMFVHLPGVDGAGHGKGWASLEQMAAIHLADAALGHVLGVAKEVGMLDHALIIVTADHGGAAITHGADDPRSRTIPWIAVGPGVRAGWDLTRTPNLIINTEDTFATSCWVLGLPVSRGWDGEPVKAIADPTDELLTDAPDAPTP